MTINIGRRYINILSSCREEALRFYTFRPSFNANAKDTLHIRFTIELGKTATLIGEPFSPDSKLPFPRLAVISS